MAGPITVLGPDGQRYQFPEGTDPAVMKQAMAKRYPKNTPQSVLGDKAMGVLQGAFPGSPNMAANAQAPAPNQNILPGMGGGNMGTPTARPAYMGDAGVIERQRLTGKAQKAIADVQNIQRKRRVEPVAAAADIAAAEAKEKARAESPFYDRTDLMAFKDAARQQVYDQANVVSPSDAFTGRSANALALGIPGIVNKDFRGQLAQAGVDQPGAAIAGDLLGFLAPGAAGWSAAARGVNALARPFIPRGADAASRTVRYGAPLAGQLTGAALTNAGYRAAVDEPIRAETAGEDLTLGGMAEAGKRGFTDPLNLIPLGLSGTNRIWNQLTSGIATPSARAAEMANRFGVGPRQTAASQGIVQTTQELGGQLQGADIRGLTNIENALRFALRDNQNIPDVNARIATGFQRIRESLPLEDDPTLNLARLIEREFAPDAPQTRDIIRRFLLKVGLDTPGGGQIVGDAANQMRGQQADVLRTELESSFGAQPKTEANAAMQQSLDQFSQAYNTVLGSAPRQGPQVDRARALLAREPQSAAILDDIAQSQNLTVEQFIERNPLQALHEVQSELATQARALAARGDAGAGPLEITVRNMQRPLRDAVPGYGDLQGLWRQWTQARERLGYVRGAESGTSGELSTVPGFGDKIFGPGGIAKSEMGTQTAADVYLQMDDLSQRAAGLSVRDVINDELRKGKAAGLEQRYESAANISKVATEGGLDALRRVFGETGDRIARRIEQFVDANEFARNIDPEFNSATMNKAQSMQTGAQPFAGPMGQATQGAAGSLGQNAAGDAFMMASGITSAPVLSAIRFVPWLANRLQPGARTQRNIAETLLRRGEIGSQVPPRPGGPAPITPIDPAMVPGARPPPGGPPPGGAPPAGGTPPQAPAPLSTGAPAMAAPAGAPVPPQAPASPAMAAPVMPPHVPILSSGSVPARSGPPPFPPPLEAMEWTGPIPREPGGLLAFIRKLGGIREEFGRFQEQGYMRGSLAQILGDVRSRPGLLNNKNGQTIDELARSARDAGFDIGDDEDFMRQLANELQGRGKSYRIGEAEEWNAYQDFLRNKKRAETSERIYNEIPFGFGIGPNAQATLQQSAFGSIGGSAYGSQNDVNGDGVIDEQDAYAGAFLGGTGLPLAAGGLRTVGTPRAPSGRTVGQGGYFGRQSMRPPGSGPSAREIETQQQWSTATPIVSQARTTAQSAQQAAEAALQSKAPADIARAKDQKKALVGQLQEAQASRAGMNTPEDARLAETLASLTENTSDPVLLSTQISAAKTSLDRLLTDIGSPVEGNLIPVRTNILTRTQAPRSAAEGPQDRASVTRYAAGTDEVKPQGFGAGGPKVNPEAVRSAKSEGFDTSRILYRGMRDPLGPDGLYATTTPGYETQGLGVSLSTSAKAASEYGGNVYPVVVKGKFFSEKEYVNRINKLYETQGIGSRDAAARVRAELAAEGYAGLKADGGKLLDKGELRVWGDDSGQIPNVKVVNDTAPSAPFPQQAARFETPGSPEYEAAVAKGLDMSQAGRMRRAKEMGFDTETAVYRGLTRPYDADTLAPGRFQFLAHDPDVANEYARNFADREGANVVKAFLRKPKPLIVDAGGANWDRIDTRNLPEELRAILDPRAAISAIATAAKSRGYGHVTVRNVVDRADGGAGSPTTVEVVWDPSNIRSVNAAFDPDKSTSSTLLAAAPFAAVGGAGLTMGQDRNAVPPPPPIKPQRGPVRPPPPLR